MQEKISIAGLDKIEILRALYDHAAPIGFGHVYYESGALSRDEAERIFELAGTAKYFSTVKGRTLRVFLNDDELNPILYDRENGTGACEVIINQLRQQTQATTEVG